jgi:hypothetical protein
MNKSKFFFISASKEYGYIVSELTPSASTLPITQHGTVGNEIGHAIKVADLAL